MLLLNESVVLIMRAKIETLLNAKSCQRGPGLAAIVINNLLGEDLGSHSPLDSSRAGELIYSHYSAATDGHEYPG